MNLLKSFRETSFWKRRTFSRMFHRGERETQQQPSQLPNRHCLIASFPRSGNTWLSKMISDILIQQQGIETETELPIYEREIIPDMDRGDLKWCSSSHFSPILMAKSHYESQPWMNRVIFLLRQPADCLISFYHFHFRYKEQLPVVENGLEHFIKEFAVEKWFNHTSSFLERATRNPSSTHLITYESLHEHCERELSRLLDFVGADAELHHVRRAIQNHDFSKHASQEKRKGNLKFYRRGEIDSAKSEMPRHLVKWIEGVCDGLYQKVARLKQNQSNLAQSTPRRIAKPTAA